MNDWPNRNAELHYTGRHECTCTVGPRGAVKLNITRVRPSGRCQTWKTRPDDFRLPVKYGLYESSAIVPSNAEDFHLASECPALAKAESLRTSQSAPATV
jgi:hypothetical protein